MGLLASPVQASPLDVFGLDATSTARAMAVTADGEATGAAATNPARLIASRGFETSLGVVVSADALKIDGQDAGLSTYVGYQLGVSFAVPIASMTDRLFFGATAHFPHGNLFTFDNPAHEVPRVLFEGSHSRRMALSAALGVRIWEDIGLGVGFSLLPDVSGRVSIDFTERAALNATQVHVSYNFAPTVGLYARVTEGLRLGLSYRAAHRSSLKVPVDVVVGEGIGVIRTSVSGYAFGEPHEVSFGAALDFSSLPSLSACNLCRFSARLEAQWRRYDARAASASRVTLYDEAGNILETGVVLDYDLSDSWRVASSLDWQPIEGLTGSVGYGYQTSPVGPQRGVLNVLDSGHHDMTFGLSYWLGAEILAVPRLGVATGARVRFYETRMMKKYEVLPNRPGFPAIVFGGESFAWHFSLMLRFE